MVVLEKQLLPPPGGKTSEFDHAETPAMCGGLLDKMFVSVCVPCNYQDEVFIGLDALGRKRSPIEIRSGIPIPLVGRKLLGHKWNEHHADYYRKLHLAGGLGQKAVRYSRKQTLRIEIHNAHHANGAYDGGVALLDNESDQFDQTVLNLAGYITPFGVRPLSQEVVELSRRQRNALRQQGIFTFEHSGTIAEFLMKYVLSQDVEFDELPAEEFLSVSTDRKLTKRQAREKKSKSGEQLIDSAIEVAVARLEPFYREVLQDNLLRIRPKPPNSAFEEVKRFVQFEQRNYFGLLEEKLTNQYSGSTAIAA